MIVSRPSWFSRVLPHLKKRTCSGEAPIPEESHSDRNRQRTNSLTQSLPHSHTHTHTQSKDTHTNVKTDDSCLLVQLTFCPRCTTKVFLWETETRNKMEPEKNSSLQVNVCCTIKMYGSQCSYMEKDDSVQPTV